MAKKEKRFWLMHDESSLSAGSSQILVDTATGVQYFFHSSGYGGGLTPLLDSQGHPLLAIVPPEMRGGQ